MMGLLVWTDSLLSLGEKIAIALGMIIIVRKKVLITHVAGKKLVIYVLIRGPIHWKHQKLNMMGLVSHTMTFLENVLRKDFIRL